MNKTKLRIIFDKLISDLDPAITIDVIEHKVNQVFESFEYGTIETEKDCEICLISFIKQIYKKLGFFKTNVDLNTRHMSSHLKSELFRYLDRPNPPMRRWSIYDNMITGTEGGVYTVLRQLTETISKWYSQKRIESIIRKCLNDLEVDEQQFLLDMYVKEFKEILPKALREKNAINLANYRKFLEQHPWTLKQLRY